MLRTAVGVLEPFPGVSSAMAELANIFAELGISLYLNEFIEQGFDTWETILDITESDLDALGVQLGHRRRLQREITDSRRLLSDKALASSWSTPAADGPIEDQKAGGGRGNDKYGTGDTQGVKRKYTRHPKPDGNSPARPPTAYVIFSNNMREDWKGRNLSFTEIAKLAGENWQNLSPTAKEPYEQHAFSRKESYNKKLAEYKKTDNYREYSQYLVEFKARKAKETQARELEIVKKPKLEPHLSTTSSNTVSSANSQHGAEIQGIDECSAWSTNGWATLNGHAYNPVLLKSINTPILSHGIISPKTSPLSVSQDYQEVISARKTSPWKYTQREDSASCPKHTRVASAYDRKTSYPNALDANGSNFMSSFQQPHRTSLQNHPLPSCSSGSNLRSPASPISTGSSQFLSPRTPLEPSLDTSRAVSSTYSQKSNGLDIQLPALSSISLFPQTTISIGQRSPRNIKPRLGIPAPMPMATIAVYASSTSQDMARADRPHPRAHEYPLRDPSDDYLDPISALLRAGEIVSRSSRTHLNTDTPPHSHEE